MALKINVNVEQVNLLKTRGKVVLSFDKEDAARFMEFIDKPVTVEFLVNEQKRKEQLNAISEDQNKKIHALIADIGSHMGYTPPEMKAALKAEFSPEQEFSIGSISKERAGDFIEFLVEFAMDQGVPLKENPKAYMDDDLKLLNMMVREKRCIICGKDADLHHITAVGMGRNRNHVGESESVMLPLCRAHHTECHQLGAETFAKRYALQVYF